MPGVRGINTLLAPLGPIVSNLTSRGIYNLPAPENYALVLRPGDTSGAVSLKYVPPSAFTHPTLLSGLANFALSAVGNLLSPGSGVAKTALAAGQSEFSPALSPTQEIQILGGRKMGWADGDSSGFSLPSLGDITGIFQGGLGQNLLNIGTQALQGYVAGQFAQPTTLEAAGPIMRSIGMAGGIAARAAGAVGRGFAARFPALAGTLAQYRLAGKNVTRAQLWSLLKRFGPEFLITGGILSAAAINELLVAGPGRRRMNAGNAKALRRCHRRMKAFHRLVQHNEYYLGSHRRRRAIPVRSSSTSITKVS